jgi:hypothetical protein
MRCCPSLALCVLPDVLHILMVGHSLDGSLHPTTDCPALPCLPSCPGLVRRNPSDDKRPAAAAVPDVYSMTLPHYTSKQHPFHFLDIVSSLALLDRLATTSIISSHPISPWEPTPRHWALDSPRTLHLYLQKLTHCTVSTLLGLSQRSSRSS